MLAHTEIVGARLAGLSAERLLEVAHCHPEQHPLFSPKRLAALGQGLFVCGDHRDTSSIQGALFLGRRCAQAALSALT